MWAVTVSKKIQNKLAKEAIINALKNKNYVMQKRSEWTNQFWQDIKEMGGSVSRLEGECEVEYSSDINLEDFIK
tara:strand:+ start:112 stop:333 length:222 start_codon:yes stop_codon:yes gene_type:complete